jgi:hypothetical protein
VRELTFRGFLRRYLRELSGTDTLSLHRLVQMVDSIPRLYEPLALWVTLEGRLGELKRLLPDNRYTSKDFAVLSAYPNTKALEQAFARGEKSLRSEYHKVWNSYQVRRDAHLRDAQLKLSARNRALSLEKEIGVSRYRIGKDLGLNPGNLHAFLTKGEPFRLSLEKSYALVEYLEQRI